MASKVKSTKNSRNTDHAKVEVRTLVPRAKRDSGGPKPGTSGGAGSFKIAEEDETNPSAAEQSLAVREPSNKLKIAASTFDGWLSTEKLTGQGERATAVATQVSVKGLLKAAKDEKEEIYRPIKEGLDALSAKYKALTDPLERVNDHLGRLIGQYDVAIRQAAMLEAEKLAKKAERKGDEQFAADVREQAATAPLLGAPGLKHYTVVRAKIVKSEEFFAAVLAQKVPAPVILAMLEAAEGALSKMAKLGLELPPGVERTEEVHT